MAKMKRKILPALLVLAALTQPLSAVNPLRRLMRVDQGDGTLIQVYRKGNGHFAFLETEDGIALMRGADRKLYYAAQAADGDLVPTDRLAHAPGLRPAEEQAYLAEKGVTGSLAYAALQERQARTGAVQVKAATPSDGLGKYGQAAPGVVSSIGNPVIPLIMVQFPDLSFLSSTTPEKVSRSRNEAGYADEPDCAGSVRDYFVQQSGGMFEPTFDVVAVVTVSKSYAYYGKDSGTRVDVNCSELVREAITLAKEQGVDFSKYAVGGQVPLVSILHAGPGEHEAEEDGYEDFLWAHFNGSVNIQVGDTKVRSYFVGNEVTNTYSTITTPPVVLSSQFSGIGVFCHEFGHALGLPDFYDTSGSNEMKHTPDLWSVMDYGQYHANGYAPIGYNAYERAFLGWLNVVDLGDEPGYYHLYPFGSEEGPTAYRITNSANAKEYFLLENRQPDTWFPAKMGHGMLITRVDYDATRWAANTLNNVASRLRFTVVPADNTWQYYYIYQPNWTGFAGDLFPRSSTRNEFSDTSVPASTVYTGQTLGRPLYNIKEVDGVMEFSYLDATITGIRESAAEAAGCVDVYGLDGRVVRRGIDREALQRTLAPGIYIVKGTTGTQKVQIR